MGATVGATIGKTICSTIGKTDATFNALENKIVNTLGNAMDGVFTNMMVNAFCVGLRSAMWDACKNGMQSGLYRASETVCFIGLLVGIVVASGDRFCNAVKNGSTDTLTTGVNSVTLVVINCSLGEKNGA